MTANTPAESGSGLGTIPGANTKPVPAAVQAALAKVRDKAKTEIADMISEAETPADRETLARILNGAAQRLTAEAKAEPVITDLTIEEARELTDEIRADAERLYDKVAVAYTGRAWVALGYASWDEYCATEFGSMRLRLPKEERRDTVCSLRESGLSIRAIASATGLADKTVQRDLASGVVNDYTSPDDGQVIDAEVVTDPKPITGIDGKTYLPKPKPEPKPDPLPLPATFGRLMRKLRDLNRIAEECLDIAEEVEFDGEYGDEDYSDANDCATDLAATVESIVEAIQGRGA